MSDLPTKDDLKELPVRAIVAYALRHARRVQPVSCHSKEVGKKEMVAIESTPTGLQS